MAIPCLIIFEELPAVAAPFYIPTKSAQEPKFFHVPLLFSVPSALFSLSIVSNLSLLMLVKSGKVQPSNVFFLWTPNFCMVPGAQMFYII